ncbi:MAG: hypothetical protein QXE31_01215 [Candidatus Woesearchaeota archaeon]
MDVNDNDITKLQKKLMYYKRKDIQKAILSYCKNREVGVRYNDSFGKRPDTLFYESEIFNFVRKGATSFHLSEERWKDPLELNNELKREQINNLRIGWDLVLDIDCPYWEYSKLSTYLFIKALKHHGIESISCKFSGNKGFHIGVPFETFPSSVNNVSIKDWFPDGPKKIAFYLVNYISKNFIKYDGNFVFFDNIYKTKLSDLVKLTGKSESELIIKKCSSCDKKKCICKKNDYKEYFDSLSIVNVDTILISPRHLFRSPYSLHEKTNLVSMPIPLGKILTFEKDFALPDKVRPEDLPIFLDSTKAKNNEAEKLIIAAFDFENEKNKTFNGIFLINNIFEKKKDNDYLISGNEIPVELFPPCILKILEGLEDGRKRSLFVLLNFLRNMNWNYDKIESFLFEWNKKNKEPLKENIIKLQIRYHKQKNGKYLPPNCKQYYQDFSVCNPDSLCEKIKNPVQYAKKRMLLLNKVSKKRNREKLTEEQKEMRRKYREKLKKEKLNKEQENK